MIPNLLCCTGSYAISDPKGSLYYKYGDYLRENGYRVQVIDFVKPERSVHYNFFHYIHEQRDIVRIAGLLVEASNMGHGNFDIFWCNCARLLLSTYIAFIMEYMPEEDHNLDVLLWMLENSRLREEDDNYKTIMDEKMEEIEAFDSEAFAVRQYKKVRTASGRTWNSIVITAIANIDMADFDSVKRMMRTDEVEFKRIGQEKTALFVVVSDTDRSLDFLVGILFTQMMQELCLYADTECQEYRLPVPVRFLLDDFATNCNISDFPKMIASFRSRGISAMLMLQAESQLKHLYGEDGNTILGSCDTYCYMGGNDIPTAQSVAVRVGKMPRTILEMPKGQIWVFRRGKEPHYGPQFDLEPFERECLKQG